MVKAPKRVRDKFVQLQRKKEARMPSRKKSRN